MRDERSASEADWFCFKGLETDERESGGRVALRYSAGSKVGWRNGWREGSETCEDRGGASLEFVTAMSWCMSLGRGQK